MRKKELCIFFFILIILVSVSINWAKENRTIQIIPGKSIAGIEIGMGQDKVISILGQPSEKFSLDDLVKSGIGKPQVLGGGEVKEKLPEMLFFHYLYPPLIINIIDNKVVSVQLGFVENIEVKGFEFLKFEYLSKDELNKLGKPTSITRDRDAEAKMLSMAPKEIKIEYYIYEYDKLKLTLGLVFETSRDSKYFIALNYMALK